MAVVGESVLSGRRVPLAVSDLAGQLALQLLRDLGARVPMADTRVDPTEELIAWRDSGLAQISQRPAAQVALASTADASVLALNALLDTPRVALRGRRLLGMRRLSHNLQTAGTMSANRSCYLLATQDASLAVNLPRADDWALLPAWLESGELEDWPAVAAALRRWPQEQALQRARCLGLAVAPNQAAQSRTWAEVRRVGLARPVAGDRPFRVLDMSHLWAGPLCSLVLQQAGAQVIRLESPQRPDGARQGPAAFFQAINAGKQQQSQDLQQADERERFVAMLADVDLVIESARPRGLQQLGLDAEDLLRRHPGLSWLSITGYGRTTPQAHWVAFGDDAAVAGGLAQAMATQHGQPAFCGDAMADPLTGLHAALLAQAAMQSGGGYMLSVALSDVVSSIIRRAED